MKVFNINTPSHNCPPNRVILTLTMKENPYPAVIENYDPNWPLTFVEERQELVRLIGDLAIAIEHIGSTAVPGLCAKPIIDIMVGLHRFDDASRTMEPLKQIGYRYVPEYEASIRDRRYFDKWHPSDFKIAPENLAVVRITVL